MTLCSLRNCSGPLVRVVAEGRIVLYANTTRQRQEQESKPGRTYTIHLHRATHISGLARACARKVQACVAVLYYLVCTVHPPLLDSTLASQPRSVPPTIKFASLSLSSTPHEIPHFERDDRTIHRHAETSYTNTR